MTDYQPPQHGQMPSGPPIHDANPAAKYGDAVIYQRPADQAWGSLVIFANTGAALALTSPKVFINGAEVHLRAGENRFTVPAGWNQVVTRSSGLYGIRLSNQGSVFIPPDAVGVVYYASPTHFAFTPRLGTTPQSRPGTPLLIVMLVMFMLLFVGFALAASATF